jgi:SecD/SecF fusion protein
MTNDEVKPIIRRKIDESIVSAFEVLRERIDGFGVTQPNIQRVGSSGRILVELPGARDINRAQELLSSTAQLEFWETIPQDEQGLSQFLVAADAKIAKLNTKNSDSDDLSNLLENEADSLSNSNPLLSKLIAPAPGSNAFVRAAVRDTAEIGAYLRMAEVKALLPASVKFTKFAWERVGADGEIAELYALKSNREGLPRISGDVVSDAQDTFDQFGKPAVSMTMNTKGDMHRHWK